MTTFNDQHWEDHWRNEIKGYSASPTTEDWHGMTRLLNQPSPACAHQHIEQKPTSPMPWLIKKKALPRLPWQLWVGLLAVAIGLGAWLGAPCGKIIPQENQAAIVTQDSFPPHYALDRYWSYDGAGNRIGEMHSDTLWLDHQVRRRGPHVLLSPGKVSDYRIDTVLHISGRGEVLSIRYDTVTPSASTPGKSIIWGGGDHAGHNDCAENITYKIDTIYELDGAGNLTTKIYSIDTTYSAGI